MNLREHVYVRGKMEAIIYGRFLRYSADWRYNREEAANQAYAEYSE